MDDLTAKLTELINNPGALNTALEQAKQLLNTGEEPEMPLDVQKLGKIAALLKNSRNSEDEALLLALKPHLSPERKAKIDTAVKMLKLLKIAPYLMEGLEGIL